MRALVLESLENGVVFDSDYPILPPAADEVQVGLHAAALNHRDVWITKGQYAGIRYPTILGSDGCGKVEKYGSEVSASWQEKSVVINPNNDWGDDPKVQQRAYNILGLPRNGTFADFVNVPAHRIHAAPAHLSAAEAAALPLAGLTAFRAVFTKGKVTKNSRVLINGVGGGVALFALQFALAVGAEVYVTSSSPAKIARACTMGAQAGFDYNAPDWHKTLLKNHGEMHLIIDSAAGKGFGALVDSAAFGGTIVLYGGTQGAIPNIAPAKLFWRQIALLGSTMGNDDEFAAMLAFVEKHKIQPIIDQKHPLEHGKAAFEQMDKGTQFGKIIIEM